MARARTSAAVPEVSKPQDIVPEHSREKPTERPTERPTEKPPDKPSMAKKKPESSDDPALRLSLLREMLLMRRFEERTAEAYALGKIGGFCHLYIGQEAVGAGAISVLRPDDYVITSYRDHGQALARGITPRAVMAELFGRIDGCSKGKGGSMHLFDRNTNFLGGHGIVAAHIPLATGVGFAIKYRGGDQVCLCFFGEAAVNNGAFHEALNMAALWQLPVVYLVENNRYGMGTALERASSVNDIAERACSYDMPNEVVDGQDVIAVREATMRAISRARGENTPTLIEVRTYRFMGHSMSDAVSGTYRSKEELDEYMKRDPIAVLRAQMEQRGEWSDDRMAAIDNEVRAIVEDAWNFADESPEPPLEALTEDVYVDTTSDTATGAAAGER
jgi:pyruvate dehydrogenase E1 component alpha subunit